MKRIPSNLTKDDISSCIGDKTNLSMIADMINLCFNKINELQEEVEKLQTQINDPERNTIVEHYPPQPYQQPCDENLCNRKYDNMKVEITPYYKNL